ncbi:oxygenase MpaB family protein [Runella sp.]|uniref:oxygenase MpaB family protein n=1 Tax=Runella sp. TaxID=1960881 RepID=UPI003D10661A
MNYFVAPDSIVRKIWGKDDTILFIFAGASAEFALNKAVDWLYFTGKLPSDPLGRLFSTVSYARQIIFADYDQALFAINKITSIHQAVEQKRAAQIPDWAYRDVLFMLIDYSIRSFELLERKLTPEEKEDIFDVFYRVGSGMGISGLPTNFHSWQQMREEHIQEHLLASAFTVDLYRQYKKHLGTIRFFILKQAQILVVPQRVNKLLRLGNTPIFASVIITYKFLRFLKVENYLKNMLLPEAYKPQIAALNTA